MKDNVDSSPEFFYCSQLEWPEIADVYWPPWELIRFWSSSVDLFWRHFDLVKHTKFSISGHFRANTRGMASNWEYWCILTTFKKIIDYGHGLLILLILAPFLLSEARQIWCFLDLFRTHGRNGLKCEMLMGPGLLVFLILAPFWQSETCQMCNFQPFSWRCIGGIERNFSCSSLSCDIPGNDKGKY